MKWLLPAGVLAYLCVCSPIAASGTTGETRSASWSASAIGPLNASVFDLAISATSCAVESGDVPAPDTLTVIDFSRPSTEKRLFVYDLASRTRVFEEFVAHGQGSGANLATAFSNTSDSHQSSLGLFRAAETYSGKHGYSLRLDGLEPGVNDRARDRAIVIHGADYVSESFISAQGRLGRSWGCPAVSSAVSRSLIDRVKGGGLVFAYYPDQGWLQGSKYLTGRCANASR